MKNKLAVWSSVRIQSSFFVFSLLAAALLMFSSGCDTTKPTVVRSSSPPSGAEPSEPIILSEGDVLKIAFPGTPNLDTTQQILRDGNIMLPLGGEIQAAGKTIENLKKELVDHYANQLVSKEVNVTVQSSTFPVFVNGAVIRPGKVLSDRPLTVLDAIMEAGGFEYSKANLKAVRVIRTKPAGNFTFNLKGVLNGDVPEPFYLKPQDIVYVPEKFQWF